MGCIETAGALTESDSEGCTSTNRVVLQLIVHETKGYDKEVEEDEGEEEHAPSALVNHPVAELLAQRAGHEGGGGLGDIGGCALEALKTAALCLVALEVGGLVAIDDNVGVLLDGGDLAV